MLSEGDERVPIAGEESPRPPSRTWSLRLWSFGAVLALTMVACIVAGGMWSNRPPAAHSAPGPGAAFLEQKAEEKAPVVLVWNQLMWQSVLQALICRVPEVKPVLLPSYARLRVQGEVYPTILKRSSTPPLRALALVDLTPSEVKVLDLFQVNTGLGFRMGGFKKQEVAAYPISDVTMKKMGEDDLWKWAQSYSAGGMDEKIDTDLLRDVSANEPLPAVTYVIDDFNMVSRFRWSPYDNAPSDRFLQNCAKFLQDKVPAELRQQTCSKN